MSPEIVEPKKPSWHKDFKWITGLFLFFVLFFTMLIYNLYLVTSERIAIDTLSMVIASSFSQKGLDDEIEIKEFMQELQKYPDKSFEPFPELKITIRGKDIASFSPREVKLYFARQIAEPYYFKGAQGITSLSTNSEIQKQIAEGLQPLSLFTLSSHLALKKVFTVLLIISLLLFIPFIYFSRRFGRLGNPGLLLFLASFPMFIITGLAKKSFAKGALTYPSFETEMKEIYYMASNSLPPILEIVSRNYFIFMIIGIVLMIIALVGGLVMRTAFKKK